MQIDSAFLPPPPKNVLYMCVCVYILYILYLHTYIYTCIHVHKSTKVGGQTNQYGICSRMIKDMSFAMLMQKQGIYFMLPKFPGQQDKTIDM